MSLDASYSISFHGVSYALTVQTTAELLVLELEQEADEQQWRGEYSAQQLEEITRKTGSFKRFAVFVEMLVAAVAGRAESVTLDLLTSADLERLRARRSGAPEGKAAGSSGAAPSADRRFLIVTYTTDFERVHFPLPLAPEAEPRPASLRRTIRRLREELRLVRGGGAGAGAGVLGASGSLALSASGGPGGAGGAAGWELERESLQSRLAEQKREAASALSRLRAAEEQLAAADAARRAADEAVERLREASRAEVRKLRKELDKARARADEAERKAASSAREGYAEAEGARLESQETIAALRARVRELTKQVGMLGGAGAGARGAAAPRARSASSQRSAGSRASSVSSGASARREREPRFDPTAYMEQKKQRIEAARARNWAGRGRSPSPMQSPARSQGSQQRPRSVGTARSSSVGSQRSRGSGAGSGGRAAPVSAAGNDAAARVYGMPRAGIPAARPRSARPASAAAAPAAAAGKKAPAKAAHAAALGAPGTAPKGSARVAEALAAAPPHPPVLTPTSHASTAGSPAGAAGAAPGALDLLGPHSDAGEGRSPEQGLWDAKRRERSSARHAAAAAGDAVDSVLRKGDAADDADIADIDRRLEKLQEYLRRAKAGEQVPFPE